MSSALAGIRLTLYFFMLTKLMKLYILYFVVCDDLSNPANGIVIINGKKIGDTATYSCNYGYYLIGDDTVACQSSGNWSGPPPICEG